jgi:two-component system OmpR family response regulator
MRILIVEDEPTLASQLVKAFQAAGYAVDRGADGEEAEFMARTTDYDAIVLDLGLPLLDGLTVLRKWRAAGMSVPVLVLTARRTWHEKVEGIDAGADDYLSKPFEIEELLARIRALIRRSTQQVSPELQWRNVTLDPRKGRVFVAGAPVALTAHEYRVLSYLMHHPSQVVSRSELIDHIYAQNFDRDSNTIEVFIGRLRKKIGADIIENVRGLGYRLRSDS